MAQHTAFEPNVIIMLLIWNGNMQVMRAIARYAWVIGSSSCVYFVACLQCIYIYQIRHLGKWQYRPANIIIAYIRRRFAVLFALEISYVARVCCDFFSRLLQCSQAIVRSFVLCLVLSPTLFFFQFFSFLVVLQQHHSHMSQCDTLTK